MALFPHSPHDLIVTYGPGINQATKETEWH